MGTPPRLFTPSRLALLALAVTLVETLVFAFAAHSWVRDLRLVMGGFFCSFCLLGLLAALRGGLAGKVLLWTCGVYYVAVSLVTFLIFYYYLPPALLLLAACLTQPKLRPHRPGGFVDRAASEAI